MGVLDELGKAMDDEIAHMKADIARRKAIQDAEYLARRQRLNQPPPNMGR